MKAGNYDQQNYEKQEESWYMQDIQPLFIRFMKKQKHWEVMKFLYRILKKISPEKMI